MSFTDLLSYEFWDNTVKQYIVAFTTFIVIAVVLAVTVRILAHRARIYAERTVTRIDDFLLDIFEGIGLPFNVLTALFMASQMLILPSLVRMVIQGAFLLIVVYEMVRIVERSILFVLSRRNRKDGETIGERKRLSAIFSFVIRIILWSFGFLLILSNLGVNVTSLIAGVGIGGIAISLALQNILGDMFSSFSLIIDKPFEEGDFIIVGDHMGVVKRIGLKTTRLEALKGEEIVISNTELTSSRVRNFRKMQRRRVCVTIGVTYGTSLEKLKRIPDIIRRVIRGTEGVEFDRAHLREFGDYSLNFEVVYYILSGDYTMYMDLQQSINFTILTEFEREGIGIAFPTRTIHLAVGGSASPSL
ncbi:MAG: mechanosensitive ion channel family protein [Candidatus Peribacteraceae bacterium]|nr:mechanosensitive ion channel family protein [Candidatus Peribacteraceae bacterium]